MVYKNQRLVRAAPEDIYEEGDVLWFKSFTGQTCVAVKLDVDWQLTGVLTPTPWNTLISAVGNGELWVATEWARQ